MKKMKRILTCLLVAAVCSVSLQSCIGKFSLTKKLHTFNQTLGNKWVNEVAFIIMVIVPVYGVCILIDGIVLNTIEFWTGSNPLAMKDGESETRIASADGVTYQITATKNRFHILQTEGINAGESVDLLYNPDTATWSFSDGRRNHPVLQSLSSGDMKVFQKDGSSYVIGRDELNRELGISSAL
ncbi:MAG: DUF3332 domain-containing protein [Spirochaetota bacterium]